MRQRRPASAAHRRPRRTPDRASANRCIRSSLHAKAARWPPPDPARPPKQRLRPSTDPHRAVDAYDQRRHDRIDRPEIRPLARHRILDLPCTRIARVSARVRAQPFAGGPAPVADCEILSNRSEPRSPAAYLSGNPAENPAAMSAAAMTDRTAMLHMANLFDCGPSRFTVA